MLSPPLLIYKNRFLALAIVTGFVSANALANEVSEAVEGGVLQTVFVSASGYEQDIKVAPASVSVINRGELETKRINSIAEALSDVEGIDVGDSVGKTGGLNISMRGMPSEYTLILIDGKRQNAAGNVTPNGFGETSTNFLPPLESIERIEVIRGPMSTLYGSDAMGGVVNIITRKVSSRWMGSVGISATIQENREFGDNNTVNVYVSGPLKEDVLGLSVRGSYYHRQASDLSPSGVSDPSVEISKRGPSPVQADNYAGGFRVFLIPHEDHELWVDVDTSRQKYDNSEEQLGTLGVRGYEDTMRFNRNQYLLAHNWETGIGRLESSITHNVTETIGRTIPTGTPNKVAGSSRNLEAKNTIFDTKLVAGIADSHILSVGGQYWRAKMIDGVAVDPYEHKQWAVFGEDEWWILPNLSFTFGARYDYHDKFGSHVSPRAYLVWSPTDNWTFKGGYSEGFKTPRLDQIAEGITGFTAQGTRPTIGTPTLKPETSRSFELGSIYSRDNGFKVAGTIFFNRFEDKIADGDGLLNCSFASAPNRPGCVDYGNWPAVDTYAQLINVDEAETKGVEASIHVPILHNLSASANYTYTRSEQKSGVNKGDPLYNTPKHMFNSSLNWKVNGRLNTWLKYEYRGSRWRSDELIRDQVGNYKSYSLFHLGGSYEVSEQFTVSATIYNLFDKDFLEYRSYTTAANTTGYTGVYNNMNEGRRLWLSALFKF